MRIWGKRSRVAVTSSSTEFRRVTLREKDIRLYTVKICVLSAFIALLTWCPIGNPSFGLLVVIPWSLCRSRRDTWLAAWAYYLTAAWQIPLMASTFFSVVEQLSWLAGLAAGLPLWLAWAGLLAAGNAVTFCSSPKWRPAGVLSGLVLTAVPPVGWLNIMSPLNAIGYWFPGTQWFGLMLGALAIFVLASTWRRQGLLPLSAMVVACHAGLANAQSDPMSHGVVWIPVDTKFGPEPKTLSVEYGRARAVSDTVLREFEAIDRAGQAAQGRVLVFPEMAVSVWRPRSQYWLDEAVQATSDGRLSWITGAMKFDADTLVNGVLVVDHGHAQWLDGQVSFPGAMWRPGGYRSPRSSPPVVELGGWRAVISICYEDLVPWAQWKAFLQKPDLHISISSLWVVKGIDWGGQARSVDGWAQMFGVPTLRSTNF